MQKIVSTNLLDKTATVELLMSRYYKSFMMAIEAKSNSNAEDRFLAGVECVVWGSLYVEAMANRTVVRFLDSQLRAKPRLKEAFWEFVERADLKKKVGALADMTECDKATSDTHLRNLGKLVVLRNRLVHYKEDPTPVDSSFLEKTPSEIMGLKEEPPGGFTYGQLSDKVHSDLPDPHIVSAVLSMPLEERRGEIIGIGEWINSLHPHL